MPIRKTGNFDLMSIIAKRLPADVLLREKERLASMLTPEEFAQVEMTVEGSRISINGPQEVLDKIQALQFVPEQTL